MAFEKQSELPAGYFTHAYSISKNIGIDFGTKLNGRDFKFFGHNSKSHVARNFYTNSNAKHQSVIRLKTR